MHFKRFLHTDTRQRNSTSTVDAIILDCESETYENRRYWVCLHNIVRIFKTEFMSIC